ncbi:hypothetical protein, partial [Mycobacterium tuberculosis]
RARRSWRQRRHDIRLRRNPRAELGVLHPAQRRRQQWCDEWRQLIGVAHLLSPSRAPDLRPLHPM